MNYVTLNNGVKMPMIGFGVFEIPKEETARCVYEALEAGYRLIDTAQAYYNEEETGDGIRQAIQKLGINREDIFLTTKVWVTEFGYEKTPAQITLRQQVQRGIVVIPKSTHKDRMKQNLDVFDFELTEDEMTRLKQLNENKSMWAEYDNPMIVQYAMSEE